jgi:hypothetical protein
MRSILSGRTAAMRTGPASMAELMAEAVAIPMRRTVSFFASRCLCEGFRISFSFSQPVGKA